MLVIGHRGAAATYPENTLAGFEYLAEIGIEWVEFDVQLSSDHIPVVFHDQDLKRTSNGNGLLSSQTWDSLHQLDVGSWFDPRFSSQRLPSLRQVLDLCADKGLKANIEIKVHSGADLSSISQAFFEAAFNSKLPKQDILVSSFSHPLLLVLHKNMPGLNLAQNFEGEALPNDWLDELRYINAYSAHCRASMLNQKDALAIKQAGYQLGSFTVNDLDTAKRLQSWGVDMIFSDVPEQLQAELA